MTKIKNSASLFSLLILSLMAIGIQPVFASPTSSDTLKYHTATPIKHLVVIFDENISFDHYFGTYPNAANTNGVKWQAKPNTPTVNGLTTTLLHHNPNKMNPKRLSPAEAFTCDNDHAYKAEQEAFNGGLMNKFVQYTERQRCGKDQYYTPGLVMDYYDGNTVTALWNYAQNFAMSDNSYGSTFGPSTPGAINLISGNTHGAVAVNEDGKRVMDPDAIASPNKYKIGTLVADPDPAPMYDGCVPKGGIHAFLKGKNIGDLLEAKHITWGWFSGGFHPTKRKPDGTPVCGATHKNIVGLKIKDYIPHHEPFQYYKSTSNPKHLPPSSISAIGHDDRANHQYGLKDFYDALKAHNLPAVSFIKLPGYADGHAGYSDPLDEQYEFVRLVNHIQQSKAWPHTAIILAYDDSDGWYDHVMGPIVNPSHDPLQDRLTSLGNCGEGRPMKGYQDRCGYGPRLPLLVISPYAKVNYVGHALTDQTSIARFIEDNWLNGQRIKNGSYNEIAGSLEGLFEWNHPHTKTLILNPCTGQRDKNPQYTHHCHWPKQAGVIASHKKSGSKSE
jgi:phospholipase C